MDQNKLDKIIKEGLEDYRSPLDKQALWQAIRDDVPRQKPPFLRLLTLGFIIGVGVASILWYINNESRQVSSSQRKVESSELSTEVNLQDRQSVEGTEIGAKIASTAPTPASQYATETPLSVTTSLSTSLKKSESKTTSPSQYTTARPTEKATSNVTLTKLATELISPHRLADQHQTSSNNDSSLNQLDADKATSTPYQTIEQNSTQVGLNSLDLISPSALEFSYSQPDISAMLLIPTKEVECYDYNKKKGIFSAEVYGLVDYVHNRMTSNAEQEAYLSERKKSQTQLEGYRSGIRLKYRLPIGLYVKSGIEAGLIRERFRVSVFETTVETLPNQLLETIEKNDSTIYIYGNKEVTIDTEKRWRIENSYRSIGVPVLLGYEFNKGKFLLGLEGGAIYNLGYYFSGHLLDNASAPVDDPDFFKPRISTSLTGGLALGYSIHQKYNLVAYCSMKHNLNSINTEENLIDQKNSRIGLGVGLEILID